MYGSLPVCPADFYGSISDVRGELYLVVRVRFELTKVIGPTGVYSPWLLTAQQPDNLIGSLNLEIGIEELAEPRGFDREDLLLHVPFVVLVGIERLHRDTDYHAPVVVRESARHDLRLFGRRRRTTDGLCDLEELRIVPDLPAVIVFLQFYLVVDFNCIWHFFDSLTMSGG